MKIGYRTHSDFVAAWDILRNLVWHPNVVYSQCFICGALPYEPHKKDCLIQTGQDLVVDKPGSL
jgi:hypothetical protein